MGVWAFLMGKEATLALLSYPPLKPYNDVRPQDATSTPIFINTRLGARSMVAQNVSIGYTYGMKESLFRIRIEHELREKFLVLCREPDRPAAQVLREFMRAYINVNNNRLKAKRKEA